MPFLASNHYFCKAKSFFGKSARFCARFLGWNTNWAKMVHAVLCTAWIEPKNKKLWNHYFSAVIWLWLFSNQSQMWHRKQKQKHQLRTLVFLLSSRRFCFTSSLVMFEKKHYFSAGFWGFLHLLSKPFVSYVGLSFCWFWFSVFYFLLMFDKSSCYVLVSVFLFWVSLVWLCGMCCFFCFFLVLFFVGGFKVRWGGPKGHLDWP